MERTQRIRRLAAYIRGSLEPLDDLRTLPFGTVERTVEAAVATVRHNLQALEHLATTRSSRSVAREDLERLVRLVQQSVEHGSAGEYAAGAEVDDEIDDLIDTLSSGVE
jgi:hypothetical protein